MKPTEHMNQPEDELIAHIKDTLQAHEELYVPGAWENFNRKEQKKTGMVFWIGGLSGIAAALTIGMLFLLFTDKPVINPVQITRTSVEEQPQIQQPAEEISKPEVPLQDHQTRVIGVKKSDAGVTMAALQPIRGNAIETPISDNTISPRSDQQALNAPVVTTTTEDKKQTLLDFLQDESKKNNEAKTARASVKDDKWEMGLVLAPSFGNTKKLNIGYGLSMAYAISKKISINSGISYNEMSAAKATGGMEVATVAGLNTEKNLESVEARITGIDIPLELKYHVSKNLYANVGISALAVISQKRNNTYIEDKLVERSFNSADGTLASSSYVVSERVTEKEQETGFDESRYIGFYNFSLGYKQKVSKNKAIAIEPFLKVPMKEVSKENLRLIGTGLKLKFDF